MAKVLVTGASGFIGSHLTKKLVSLGHDVTILNRASPRIEKNLGSVINKVKLS